MFRTAAARFAGGWAPRRTRSGFTLVELLVVGAVIALLAGLLLPALSTAKQKALRMQCVSNLRQVGVAQHIYVQEHEFYPLATTGGGSNSWAPALGLGAASQVLFCPQAVQVASEYLALFKFTGSRLYPHYGYNFLGAVRRNPLAWNLGLGGNYLWGDTGGTYVPTKENRVIYPSQMIALGDSDTCLLLGMDAKTTPNYTNLLHIAFPHAVPLLGRPGIGQWHDGGAQMLFCDGHVAYAKQSQWAEASPAARRLWNNDHQPHEECW